jgi:hypothetical protein
MLQDILKSDPLGVKGESRFQEICADAGLICNKSTWDRTGWDYIVEFGFEEATSARPLDSRSTPLSSHVQVRTLLAHNDRVKLRLSAAERLAKELKPAFVYVFKVVGTKITDAFLIHIIDEPLASILKRLRQEHAIGNAAQINKKYISFAASALGARIEPTGEALRGAIQAACGPRLDAYATRKMDQLNQLGFEPFPYRGTLRFRQLRGLDELVDVFLGLERNIEIDRLEAFEVRFGIPLPLRQFAPATQTVSIDPHPFDSCTITVRNDELGLPGVFKAELFVPAIPNLPIGSFKYLVKSTLFSFLVPLQGQLSFWQSDDIGSQKHPPECWVNHARLLVGLATGKANLEIRADNRLDHLESGIYEVDYPLDFARCEGWLALCEYTLSLFKLAGIPPDIGIRIKDIDETSKSIIEAFAIFNGKVNGLSFVTSRPQDFQVNGDLRGILASSVSVGDVVLAYYVLADLTPEIRGDQVVWQSANITPGKVRFLRGAPGEFLSFLEYARAETKADVFGVLRSPEGATLSGKTSKLPS